MKTSFKLVLFSALTLFVISCGGKKEDQDFGTKPTTTEEKATTDGAFPLAEKGKEIFEGKGTCFTCHKKDVKIVGPSIQDIVKIYKEKNGNIVTFLKGEADPLVDPSQFEVMKANFAITKTMTEEELQSLEQYMQSEGK